MSAQDLNTLELAHRFLREQIHPGDLCIDATAGRGGDTALLCELVGETGHVLAFDIQEEALESTRQLLAERSLSDRAELILDSHSNMANYAKAETVSAITFNFGWLPGGKHGVFTRAETSIPAIEAGLSLLRSGGVMSLCIYYGRDCGFAERDALLAYMNALDHRRYTVLLSQFPNRPNNPPIAVFLWKD